MLPTGHRGSRPTPRDPRPIPTRGGGRGAGETPRALQPLALDLAQGQGLPAGQRRRGWELGAQSGVEAPLGGGALT